MIVPIKIPVNLQGNSMVIPEYLERLNKTIKGGSAKF